MRLSTLATEVLWRRSEVRVACRSAFGGEMAPLHASRLVVTLPLGVLTAPAGELGAVVFTPGVSAKTKAVSHLAMGNVLRLTLRFRERFWTNPLRVHSRHRSELGRLSFVHAPRAPIPTWWTTYPLETPLLTAWAGGPSADELLARGEASIVHAALESLTHAFGAKRSLVEGALEKTFFHDWAADPFARGAYSYPLVGGADAGKLLSRPVEDTLFFAGEATAASPDNGTVQGALASGKRAARQVLRSLRSSK